MKIVDDDRGNKPADPYAAVLDIERRNKENKGNFTKAQDDTAHTVRILAQAVHTTGKVYPPNYRKNMIAVKVDGYRARDKLSPEYPKLDNFCTTNNVVCHTKPSNPSVISYIIK